MVSYKSLAAAALMSASTLAVDVECLVNGVSVATVDLDTGVCPFTVPLTLPVLYEYTSANAYDVEFYYVDVPPKYFTDIEAAGREIDIPASELYGKGSFPLYQVHVSKTPSTNSTEAIRRRLMKESLLPRDEVSDFITSLEGIDGTEIDATVEVVLASSASSSGAASSTSGSGSGSVTSAPTGTATVTNKHTTVVTITSCSDDKCVLTTVPATPSEIVTTVNEEVTTYTTYCPLTGDETLTVTHASTKVVTITSCSDNKCSEKTVAATPSVVTTTVEAVESVYTTWCPVDTTETVVSEGTEYYTATTVATSAGELITKTTVIPVIVETTEYYTPVTTTYISEGAVVTATTVAPVTEESSAAVVTTTYTSGGEVVTATTVAAEATTEAPAATEAAAEESETTITLQSTTYKTAVAGTTVATTSSGAAAATSGAVTIPASENVAGASKASMLALIVIPLAYFI